MRPNNQQITEINVYSC